MNIVTSNEVARNNKVGMNVHLATDIIMIMFILIQFLSHMCSFGYLATIVVLGLAPCLAERYYWKKDHETGMIKHFLAIGYALFYTFCIFTSSDLMVFAFVIPMIIIISIYNDVRYTLLVNIVTVIESFLLAIIGAQTGKFGYVDRNNAVIQVVVMIMVAVFSVLAARVSRINFKEKINTIEKISENVNHAVVDINNKIVEVNDTTQTAKSAIDEVNAGVADTASAVQNQLLQTESIQKQIDTVNGFVSTMAQNVKDTLNSVKIGDREVELLVSQADVSVEISKDVESKLNELQDNMKQMNSITKLIDDIAFQTNIMAINANIEAARVGEAGRGFAVVANQVSQMSIKTKEATDNIEEMIKGVLNSLSEVVLAVEKMSDVIEEEKKNTTATSDSFNTIFNSTVSIGQNVDMLVENLDLLTRSNLEIVGSVQTISAASEQVAALTTEAVNAENRSAGLLSQVTDQIQQLARDIEQR